MRELPILMNGPMFERHAASRKEDGNA